MAEAKKTTSKKTAKTADSKKDKKLSTVSRKPSAKVAKKETDNGITKDSAKAAVQAVDEAKEVKPAVAKAGRRSAKAIAEAQEKQAKEERKAAIKAVEEAPKKPKVQQKPPRSRLERRGKNYRKLAEQIDKTKLYALAEALELATKTSPVKFDATVELHVRLAVDPKQADQNIRDTVVMPAGTGKAVRIAVFAEADDVTAAKKAGADIAAGDEFLQQLDKNQLDFDVLIATPAMMPRLGKYAKLLGPKGLMPNPKSGTVTGNVAKAVSEAKAGRVEYRVDTTGIVHVGVGKVSFGSTKLQDNARAVLTSIKANKPASVKSGYLRSVFVTTSMGPSISVDLSEI